MSFTSLLFCPDEKTARLVTQVLSELDFTVEMAHESFAAVQRLAEEHFHALVVDCQNEQDAALLFKAARNSEHNSSSLSVAVVEGQAGVAKAFRIGANLVLTKPINVEQSKSTLRVARGLLKKTQPKSSVPASSARPVETRFATKPAESVPSSPQFEPPSGPSVQSPAFSGIARPAVNAPTPASAAAVPFSGLVVESDPEPATEAADAAVLESLPEIKVKRIEGPASIVFGQAEPAAAGTTGQAAAAALAPEHKLAELRPAGASPMVTNEQIVSTVTPDREPAPVFDPEPISAPSFSSLEVHGRSTGGGRFLKIFVVVALVAAGGYFAWQQPKAREYAQRLLHRGASADQPATAPDQPPAADNQHVTFQPPTDNTSDMTSAPAATEAPITSSDNTAVTSDNTADATRSVPSHSAPVPQPKASARESIEVQELPMTRDAGKVTVAPKIQPIIVKSVPSRIADKAAPIAAPPVSVVSGASDAKFPDLIADDIELPKPQPGVVRISQGVSQGLLLKKVQPVYPSLARQFHRDGPVQLLATIDKHGTIKKVQALSGDSMLSRAAVDAVKQWEYRPYLLNGQPVEIETQITIVFKAQ